MPAAPPAVTKEALDRVRMAVMSGKARSPADKAAYEAYNSRSRFSNSGTIAGQAAVPAPTPREFDKTKFDSLMAQNNTRTPVQTPQAQYDARLAAANPPAGGADAFANAIYGQESGSGRASTAGVNYAGASGPMQMLEGTFKGAVRMGLVPGLTEANANWRDPAHNTAVGKAYAAHLFKKYGGDTQKAAAAYYTGEPNVDGGGNYMTYRDLKNPNAPNVGQYVQQVQARMGGTPQGQAPQASQGQPSIPATPNTPLAKATAGGYSKEQVMQIAQQQVSMAQREMAHLQEEANITRDPAAIEKLRAHYAVLQNVGREAELFNLYASGRIPAEQYQFLSAKARDAAAAASAEMQKAAAKAQGEIAVGAARGEQDRATEEAKSNFALQKIAIEAGFKPGEFKEVPMGDGKSLIAARGRLYRVETDPGNKFRPGGPTLVDITPER
jgi:hypothetical protein